MDMYHLPEKPVVNFRAKTSDATLETLSGDKIQCETKRIQAGKGRPNVVVLPDGAFTRVFGEHTAMYVEGVRSIFIRSLECDESNKFEQKAIALASIAHEHEHYRSPDKGNEIAARIRQELYKEKNGFPSTCSVFDLASVLLKYDMSEFQSEVHYVKGLKDCLNLIMATAKMPHLLSSLSSIYSQRFIDCLTDDYVKVKKREKE